MFRSPETEEENFNNNFSSGVSIENASYIEENKLEEKSNLSPKFENDNVEHTPRLFSEEENNLGEEHSFNEQEENNSEQLFDQKLEEEEDFEIPAFLRKQKF